jgi:CheY-like chemotaxis protein
MTPKTSPTPVPHSLSILEAELYRHLAGHASSEADLIASYRELADAPTTPEAARYLLRLVVEDEERHHRVMHEIASAVGEGVAWTTDGKSVPNMWGAQTDPALEEVTKRFLAAERADRKELRALRKELKPYREETLWSLLVELMERDTDKHILLLTFIHNHAARRKKR